MEGPARGADGKPFSNSGTVNSEAEARAVLTNLTFKLGLEVTTSVINEKLESVWIPGSGEHVSMDAEEFTAWVVEAFNLSSEEADPGKFEVKTSAADGYQYGMDAEDRPIRPPESVMHDFFHVYDLDGSGAINSPEELEQLTTFLIFDLQLQDVLGVTPPDIEVITAKKGKDIEKSPMSMEEACNSDKEGQSSLALARSSEQAEEQAIITAAEVVSPPDEDTNIERTDKEEVSADDDEYHLKEGDKVEHAVEGEGMVIMVMPDEDPWNGRITVKFFEVENCLRFEKDGLEEPTPGADGKISELQITMIADEKVDTSHEVGLDDEV